MYKHNTDMYSNSWLLTNVCNRAKGMTYFTAIVFVTPYKCLHIHFHVSNACALWYMFIYLLWLILACPYEMVILVYRSTGSCTSRWWVMWSACVLWCKVFMFILCQVDNINILYVPHVRNTCWIKHLHWEPQFVCLVV